MHKPDANTIYRQECEIMNDEQSQGYIIIYINDDILCFEYAFSNHLIFHSL